MTAARRTSAVVLAVLTVAALVRLLAVTWGFVTGSLQLDYSAYDTAGDAVRAGLDPYRTWPDRMPPLWDGKAAYSHSRFLYPPLVAWAFAPLGALPYPLAKALFTLGSLLALAGAFLILTRGLSPGRRAAVALGLLTAHPVLALLERGQVDAYTLLLVCLAFAPALGGRTPGLGAGAWLAGATLMKLNAVYLCAFWLRRGLLRGLLGFGLGGILLFAASLAVHGPGPLRAYLERELPRIVRHGEDGPRDWRLPSETMDRLRGEAPHGFVLRDGRLYEIEPFGFAANASLARVAARALQRSGLPLGAGVLSLAIVGAALAAAGRRAPEGARGELAFLAAATSAVLLAGPLTWAMNVVWLLPAAAFLAAEAPGRPGAPRRALALLALGLVLAWVPDQHSAPWLYPLLPSLGNYKYVAAEALVLAGALASLRAATAAAGGG